MTTVVSPSSGSRLRSAEPSDANRAESREEILRRHLAARRKAKESAALPSKPEPAVVPETPIASSSGGGLSIKGKAREIALPERPGGLRAWDEGAAAKDDERETIALPARPASPRRAVSEESSLAYPRSPSPRRSRSPRRRYRDRSPPRHDDERDRSPFRGPERVGRPRSPDRRYSRSPRRRELLDPSSPRRDTSRPRRRSPDFVPRDRSPPPPPRRTFDNPERLAMRQGRDFPPHPYPQHQRYDPRRNTGGPIQAEPMRGADQREGRASPSYNSYERPPHMAAGFAENGAKGSGPGPGPGGYGYGPGRRDLGSAPPLGQQGQGGGWQNPPRRFNGPVDFEQRRLQRENSTVIAWPASPKEPYRDEEEIEADRRAARKANKAKSKSKKTKHRSRYSSASSSESDDSEAEKRTKRKRDKRRRHDSSASDSDSEVGEKRGKRRPVSESDSEDEEEERRRRKRKSKSKSKSRARSMVLEDDEEWLEKRDGSKKGSEAPLSLEDLARMQQKKKEEEEEIGPILPTDTVRLQQRQRYEDMRPGEGEAMALYASNGMRIPRRGEIGLDTERIQNLEGSGYVMSGARNKKMNAMRLRKENQVINAEEKRAILNLQREEKIKREGMIVSQFKELMNTSLQRQG